MPLTRHFYALDEVHAGIFYAGSRGIPKETAFWCHELVISGYVSEAISALFETWLWHRGPFHLSWFLEAMTCLGGADVVETDIVRMAQQVSMCATRDHSLSTLLVITATDPDSLFDHVVHRSPARGFPSDDPLEQYFIRAMYQHKAGAAWWAGLHLSVERWWFLIEWYSVAGGLKETGGVLEAIRGYEQLLGYQSDEYDRVIRALLLLFLCLTDEQREKSMDPHVFPCSLSPLLEWEAVLGRKAGRIYPIPYYGLYGTTIRGRMRQMESTLPELADVRKGIRGCAVWDEVCDELCNEMTDSICPTGFEDVFYSTYFPDDIPDEWTAKEKEKSHGAGLLQRTELVTLWGYIKRYLSGRTRILWSKKVRSDVLEAIPLQESAILTFISLSTGVLGPMDIKQLRPVHKRKVVLTSSNLF